MLDSTTKADLFKCFSKYGDVVDVYMGGHKDKSGSNFAFVKINGVENARGLENELQGTMCGGRTLSVNIARYGRNKIPVSQYVSKRAPIMEPSMKDVEGERYRVKKKATEGNGGGLSYAEVSGGSRSLITPPLPPTTTHVRLFAKGTTRNWLSNDVLIGEALSLDHLAAIPNHFVNGDGIIQTIKYAGGLNVALCFKEVKFAEEFIVDSGRWIEWLQWVKKGDCLDTGSNRIAWLKIIGLPTTLLLKRSNIQSHTNQHHRFI
ncbi:hypothetical protein LXL04_010021 [Taraxacum kok-saghyz]